MASERKRLPNEAGRCDDAYDEGRNFEILSLRVQVEYSSAKQNSANTDE